MCTWLGLHVAVFEQCVRHSFAYHTKGICSKSRIAAVRTSQEGFPHLVISPWWPGMQSIRCMCPAERAETCEVQVPTENAHLCWRLGTIIPDLLCLAPPKPLVTHYSNRLSEIVAEV